MKRILCLCARKARAIIPALLLCLMPLAPCKAQAASPAPTVREIWKAGGTSIAIIQDAPGAMPLELFKGPASVEQKKPYFPEGKAEAGINVFVLRAGGTLALFDSGNGQRQGAPGRLLELLPALGASPEAVDLVLLTHMHTDHVGGLLKDGKRAFPKAKIMASKPELAYWLELAEKEPSNANAALVKTIVAAYGKDFLPPFAYGDSPLPGLSSLNAAGHTPGHSAFLLEAEGKSLLIGGDLVHAASLQFPLPDECAVYDMDMPAAIAARKRLLDMAAGKKLPVVGMHMPFPGIGTVHKAGQGYRLEKIQ